MTCFGRSAEPERGGHQEVRPEGGGSAHFDVPRSAFTRGCLRSFSAGTGEGGEGGAAEGPELALRDAASLVFR